MKAGKYAVVPWRAAEAIPGAGKYAKRARKMADEAAMRRTEKFLGVKSKKELGKRVGEALKKLEERASKDLVNDFDIFDNEEKAAAVQILTKREQRQKLSKEQQKGALQTLIETGKRKEILKIEPDIVLDEELGPIFEKTIDEVIDELSPKEVAENVSAKSLYRPEVAIRIYLDKSKLDAMAKSATREKKMALRASHMEPAYSKENISQEQQDIIRKRISDMSKDPKWQIPYDQKKLENIKRQYEKTRGEMRASSARTTTPPAQKPKKELSAEQKKRKEELEKNTADRIAEIQQLKNEALNLKKQELEKLEEDKEADRRDLGKLPPGRKLREETKRSKKAIERIEKKINETYRPEIERREKEEEDERKKLADTIKKEKLN